MLRATVVTEVEPEPLEVNEATPTLPTNDRRGSGRSAPGRRRWCSRSPARLPPPGKNSPRADAVLTASEAGLSVMFVEVDNGTENPVDLSYKAARYREFFRRTVGRPAPLRTRTPGRRYLSKS
ncbi:replication-relaxation family protein [Streptomyces lydicus]|uniref:replication-relaxation family protein n=1 Tax=Streptomyces lydicus TaxID=47763 RepID=UPI0037B5B435